MASYSSSVDDPEKHFLGNLLDDDTSFSTTTHNTSSNSSHRDTSSSSIIPSASVIAGVGPISGASRFWPEPPPPYSPAIDPNSHYGGYMSLDSSSSRSDRIIPTSLKQSSQWDDLLATSHPLPQLGGSSLIQPQIHHHHLNLHHHTHTHSVLQVSTYDDDSLGFPSRPLNHIFPIGPPKDRLRTEGPLSAPVVANKMPFSYRDVAARSDTPTASNNHSPPQQTKKTRSGVDMRSDQQARNIHEVAIEQEKITSQSDTCVTDERRTKHEQEFQKITRKKAAKSEKTPLTDSLSLPMVGQTAKVDVPTRYEVLQKLGTPKNKNGSENGYGYSGVPKRETTRTVQAVRSRSNSLVAGEDEESGGRSSRKSVEVKKKSNNQPQKKRNGRRKSDSDWMGLITKGCMCVWSYFEAVFVWILSLIVDFCIQVYDLMYYTATNLGCEFGTWIRNFAGKVSHSICSGLISVRQMSLKSILQSQDDQPWGLHHNMLPQSGEEALDRLLTSECQDAYGVLGLRADCSEEDIMKHYKKLSFLLDPDRNPLEGAEEASELVWKAFDAIGTPETRMNYNLANLHKNPLHKEMHDLFDRMQHRVNEARFTMSCRCGVRHPKSLVKTTQSEARYCKRCETRHAARHNDIWVETSLLGFVWLYYTCTDGFIYDITEWATCHEQKEYFKKAIPNSHIVSHRLTFGRTDGPSGGGGTQQDRLRDAIEGVEDARGLRSLHGQICLRPPEPRDEDRSRRAANRRQKKWR